MQPEIALDSGGRAGVGAPNAIIGFGAPKPTIVVNADSFGGVLAAHLRRFPEITGEFDVHSVRSLAVRAPQDEPIDEKALHRCAVVLEQIGDFPDDRRRRGGDLQPLPVPPECRRIRFPALFMDTLWPFVGEDPRSDAYMSPWMPEGPYPGYVCNQLIIAIMREEADPERIFERFMEIPIAQKVDLDRLHQLTMRKIRRLDRDSDLAVGDFIERHFATKRLFLTQTHPNSPMLRYLIEQVLAALSLPLPPAAGYLEPLEEAPGIGSCDAPIHPQIVEHFDLAWARGLTYRHHSEGQFDFAEFTRRYIRLDWTPSFYVGRQLAAEGRFKEAEGVLQDAVRLNPSREFGAALQRVREQVSRPPPVPMLVEELGSYNIVKYGSKFIGVPLSLGPIHVDEVDLGLIPGMLVSDRIDRLREAIKGENVDRPRRP